MNGPVKMYRTRQIVRHDLETSLPDCMYKLKNIHAANNETGPSSDHVSAPQTVVNISKQVNQFLKNLESLPEMSALVERQEKILQQLDELRQQMLSLKLDLGACSRSINAKVVGSSFLELHELPNLIIIANPLYPPHSLLILKTLWNSHFNFHVTTHLHSTISSVSDKVMDFSKTLENHASQVQQPTINLKLIWKTVGPVPELIISHTPIVGEVNILRYLARMYPDFLKYESLENVFEIDSVLDLCHLIRRSRTKTERASFIQSLNKNLGKSQFLCGQSTVTIADIAAYSALKQVAANEINQNLTKWLKRCDAAFI